jgi:hypothetical protein
MGQGNMFQLYGDIFYGARRFDRGKVNDSPCFGFIFAVKGNA